MRFQALDHISHTAGKVERAAMPVRVEQPRGGNCSPKAKRSQPRFQGFAPPRCGRKLSATPSPPKSWREVRRFPTPLFGGIHCLLRKLSLSPAVGTRRAFSFRSEEHTSEL